MQLVRELIDTGILLILCLVLGFVFFLDANLAAVFLLVLSLQAFILYSDNQGFHPVLYVLYSLLCFPLPLLCLFIPAMAYPAIKSKNGWWFMSVLLPVWYSREFLGFPLLSLISVITGVGALIRYRSFVIHNLQTRFFNLEDESKILLDRLEERQLQLIEQQDVGIHGATMKERNRIARDIHDNVGHLLSSALLQTAALKTLAEDTFTPIGLVQLEKTLNLAMSSIRESVHQLHETSVSLEQHLEILFDSFHYCPLRYTMDMYTDPDKDLKYALIAIVKEALSNIMKHSNPTHLVVQLKEHPGFYQLYLENDGVKEIPGAGTDLDVLIHRGIGLKSMQERVEVLGGQFKLSVDQRFCIFLTLPKSPGPPLT